MSGARAGSSQNRPSFPVRAPRALQGGAGHADTVFVVNPVRRGKRFPVTWPLQYRRAGETQWLTGRTVNMSISGVLFVAQDPLTPEDRVELSIWIEAPDRRVPTSVVGAMGRVVRTEPSLPGAVAVQFNQAEQAFRMSMSS